MQDTIDETQAQALDRFLDELVENPDIPAPLNGELDPETIAAARHIVSAETSDILTPAAESAVQARVWQKVMAGAPHHTARPFRFPGASWSSAFLRVGLAAAGIVAALGLSLYLWGSQPASVSAQEIVDKARTAMNSPAASRVTSLVLTETQSSIPGNLRLNAYARLNPGESLTSETKRWFQAPNRWRIDYTQWVVSPNGQTTMRTRTVEISDGKDLWHYDLTNNVVAVDSLDPNQSGKYNLLPLEQDFVNLDDLLQQARTCFDPHVTGKENVAGRAAWVLDLGATRCPAAGAPEMNGRLVLWVDAETFIVLKQEQHSTFDDSVIVVTRQVTAVQYNVSIDPAQMSLTPPPGAVVTDNRSKPAPTEDQFKQQLQELSRQAGIPILAPGYVPQGLAPRQPRIDPSMGGLVEISYYATAVADKDSLESRRRGLIIWEQRSTAAALESWTKDATPATVGEYKAWLRQGVQNPDGSGSESAVILERDGVLITLSAWSLSPQELQKIAGSLEVVR